MSSERTNICILGAAFNTGNMGVSVLAAGALSCVLHAFPRARIIQLDYERRGYSFEFAFGGEPVNVDFVNIRFSKKIYLANNIALLILLTVIYRLIPISGLRARMLSNNSYLREIIETDLVVSLAGGDSFSDIYGLRRMLYTSLPQLLMLFAGKRLVLLPQTIGPFRRRVSKVIARYILKRAELVYSRDHIGEKTVKSILGRPTADSKVRFCYDLGFDVDPAQSCVLQNSSPSPVPGGNSLLVGFNVSGLLMMGGYSQDNMFGLRVPYERLVLRLIEFLIEERSATILLIPHVLGTGGESDCGACEKIFETLEPKYKGRISIARDDLNYRGIKYLIGQCEFFIGGRMHACIGALSQCVPALSIAYSDKFAGVMESIGIPNLVIDPRCMEEEPIIQLVDRMLAKRQEIRHELEKKMPEVKRTIRSALREIACPDTAVRGSVSYSAFVKRAPKGVEQI